MTLDTKINQNKITPTWVISTIIAGAFFGSVALCYGVNYALHESKHYVEEGKAVYTMVDGFFGHDEYIVNKDGSVEINRYSIWGNAYSTDIDGDKIVDEFTPDNPNYRGVETLYRDKDYEENSLVFDLADQNFKILSEMFEPIVNK